MVVSRRRLFILAVAGAAAVPVLATWLSATAQRVADSRGPAPGKFLVARRELPDPNFENSVILLIQYSPKAAMGLVINHRTNIRLSRVLGGIPQARDRQDWLYIGGPVQRGALLALQRSREGFESAGTVLGEIHLITDRALLEKALAAKAGPERLRVYAGYSGWGPGQLDRELMSETWHVLEGNPDLVFDPRPEDVWQRLIRRTELRYVFRWMAQDAERAPEA